MGVFNVFNWSSVISFCEFYLKVSTNHNYKNCTNGYIIHVVCGLFCYCRVITLSYLIAGFRGGSSEERIRGTERGRILARISH